MEMKQVRSLGGDASYTITQIRVVMPGVIRVQVLAPSAPNKNRSYGFSFELTVPEELTNTLTEGGVK